MEDEEIALFNACTDLVGLKKMEAFPLQLLQRKQSGEWIGVREFSEQVGVAAGEFGPELFATWLPDPMADDGYAVIVFYDDEPKWSMTAHYNRARLLSSGAKNQTQPPPGVAVPVTETSVPMPTAPAAEL